MKYRQNITQMSDDDILKFSDVFNTLYNSKTPQGVQYNRFAWWVRAHTDLRASIHWGPAFLPWHRYYLHKFELFLQDAVDEELTIPYWDPTRDDSRDLTSGKLQIFTGMSRQHRGDRFSVTVRRNTAQQMANTVDSTLPTTNTVIEALNGKSNFYEFRRDMEAGPIHVGPHSWVGGYMAVVARSAGDPLFFLHHCNIDRLWAIWQRNNPHLSEKQQYSNRTGHPRDENATAEIDEAMAWPYGGQGLRSPRSVLDHTALGYGYERDFQFEEAWYDRYDTILITGDKPLVMESNAPSANPVTIPAPAVAAMQSAVSEVETVIDDETPLYGNKQTKELHEADCSHFKRMNDENKVEFRTLQTALEQGYNGCHFCLDAYDTD